MVATLGVTGTAILISILITCLLAVIEVLSRSKQNSLRACMSSKLPLYVVILVIGNAAATLFVSVGAPDALPEQFKVLGPWPSAFIYAFIGIFAFEGVVSNTNITYLSQNVLTFQNWVGKALDPAVAAAVQNGVQGTNDLRENMAQRLQTLEEDQLNTHLATCCGGSEFVMQIEAEAKASGSNPKLYKALELADRAPNKAAAILKTLESE